MNKPPGFVIIMVLALVVSLVRMDSTAFASDNEYTKPSMKGLNGVYILVESMPVEIEKKGLTGSQIKMDVDSKFQMAGIKILTGEKDLSEEGNHYLYVNVNVFNSELSELYFFSISVEFHQDVFLVRKPHYKVHGSTWTKRYIGITSKLNDIRTYTKDMVGIFINAYLSVNPK